MTFLSDVTPLLPLNPQPAQPDHRNLELLIHGLGPANYPRMDEETTNILTRLLSARIEALLGDDHDITGNHNDSDSES